jgi:glycosyltransferase involved in cell wall biosynthesis
MGRLNILHTIETGGPGGAENVLLNIIGGLDPARFRSLAVINESGWLEERLRERGVPTIRVQWNRWYDMKLPRALADAVRSEGVGLIHSHLPDQNFYSCIASRITGCPAIVTYHGPVELQDARSLRGWAKLQTVKRIAAQTVTVCDCVRSLMLQAGFPAGKLQRIYNGIDPRRFEGVRGDFRHELRLASQTPLIGMVANVRAPKGHEYFIRAARIVIDRFPKAQFVVAGDLHPTLAPPLFELAASLKVMDNLRFLGLRSDIPNILRDLDVYVLPSTSEGFPLALLEAMACGVPVVATRCGGAEEMVEEGKTGFKVQIRDAEAIAARVIDLLENRSGGIAMGIAGRQKVQQDFSIRTMVERYEQLYESCVGARAVSEVCVQGAGYAD